MRGTPKYFSLRLATVINAVIAMPQPAVTVRP